MFDDLVELFFDDFFFEVFSPDDVELFFGFFLVAALGDGSLDGDKNSSSADGTLAFGCF
jgi:hypothetical protein